MKRLLSATLALSLLGGSAALASPYDRGDQGYNGSYGYQDRGYDQRDRHDNNGAAIFTGVGIAALAIALASQHSHHGHYHGGWYNRDNNDYRGNRGYGRGYDRGYDHGYGSHYDGRDDSDHR